MNKFEILCWSGVKIIFLVRYLLSSFLFVMISACSVTAPVAAISESGEIMRGQATAILEEGAYFVSDGQVTCTDSRNPLDGSLTIPLSILCDDGRTGIGSATRTASATFGSGQFSMSDGSQWRFVFGEDAALL